MVRIIGNSPERVPISDLGDVIYYRQIKDYSDEEYKNSVDLKKAIRQGKVSKIEEKKSSRGSTEIPGHAAPNEQTPISIRDLKAAIRELIPEKKDNGSSNLVQAVREIGPMIADMVRQELSKISITTPGQPITDISTFKGPEYIPDVSREGMIDSIEPEERKVSVDDVDENLAALRKLKQNKSKSK